MRIAIISRTLFILLFVGLAACQDKSADLIVVNGRVAAGAGDDFVSAFAVKDGRFLVVGEREAVMATRGADTEVIDAGGRTVIPGLNDSHSHVIRGGLNYALEIRWDGVTSLKAGLAMLKEQAARTPEGSWVKVVGGFGEFQFEARRLPTLAEINAAVPDRPCIVAFLYTSAFVNQKGIEALGYDAETSFPGGVVELDGQGKPTGMLIARPGAAIIYFTLVETGKLSPENQELSTRHFVRQLNRLGMTSAIDAGGGGQFFPDNYAAMKRLAEKRQLHLRVGYYIFNSHRPGMELREWKKYLGMVKPGDNYDMFRPNGYIMCGAGENIVWSAGDFENFKEPRPDLAGHMEGELTQAITMFARKRWPFRIHATYDESIQRMLSVLEDVNAKHPFASERWLFDHAETVSEESLKRIKALGGGVAIQNRMLFQGEYFVKRYGATKAADAPPIRKMLDMGIPVGLGTDGTRVSSYNPWLALYWVVSGKTWGGLKHLADANRLSRREALRMMTHGSAWFSGEQDQKGMIAPGLLADFVILRDDFFSIPEEQIKDLEAVLTVVGGRVVYGADDFADRDPELPAIQPEWSPVKFYGGYAGKL